MKTIVYGAYLFVDLTDLGGHVSIVEGRKTVKTVADVDTAKNLVDNGRL